MIVFILGYFCLKMIVLLPKSFCPKMNVQFLCDLSNDISETFDTMLDIRGSKLNISGSHSHHQEDFPHRKFLGCYGVVVVFLFEHRIYNYSDNEERALILPKLEMRTMILGQRQYDLNTYELHLEDEKIFHNFIDEC